MIYKIVQDVKRRDGETVTLDVLIKEDDIDSIQTVLSGCEYSRRIILKRDIKIYPDEYSTEKS